MIMKKMNAVCSWMVTLALLGHLGTMGVSMFTGWYNDDICKSLAYLTAAFFAVHVMLSLLIVFFFHDGTSFSYYAKRNKSLILQRITGLIMIAFVHLHVKSFQFIVHGTSLSAFEKVFIVITEAIFFISIFIHMSASFVKSLIVLGLIRTEKTEKTATRIVNIICTLVFLFVISALVFFLVGWNGFGG